ncbi:MAG: hypothetical protein MJ074_07210 [Oscillospiraceae bacterium]|nr:hypothetical protein [Oscillospiraceae bacterium]
MAENQNFKLWLEGEVLPRVRQENDEVFALLRYANEETGGNDTTLGAAVIRLVQGYGKGGSAEMQMIEELTVAADTHEASYATRYVGRGFRELQLEIVWAPSTQNTAEASVNVSPKGTSTSGAGNAGAGQISVSWAARKTGTQDTAIKICLPYKREAKTGWYYMSNMSQGLFGSFGASAVTELSGFTLWNTSAWIGAGTTITVYAR